MMENEPEVGKVEADSLVIPVAVRRQRNREAREMHERALGLFPGV